jgi:hypothetical protein
MSAEDRLRAATLARADLVRDIRHLDLPEELPARARRRAGRTHPARHWLNWGAPLAAAVVVTVVALLLVVFRQAPAAPPRPAAPTTPAVSASVPRFYVALAYESGTSVSTQSTTAPTALVVDDRTGQTIDAWAAYPGLGYSGVTAAADDHTFVLSSYQAATRQTRWFLLRITTGGAAHPGWLTKSSLTPLPIKPLAGSISGLALSPDGRELAVMFAGPRLTLRTYSVSSGELLGSWQTNADYWMPRTNGANAFGLSWGADNRDLTFRFDGYAPDSTTHLVTVRTLKVTAAGHDLLADSRLVLQLPLAVTTPTATEPCFASLTAPDGKTVVCGTFVVPAAQGQPGCTSTPPSFGRYSAATGKLLQVLYRYPAQCPSTAAVPLWTDDSDHDLIALLMSYPNGNGPPVTKLSLISGGRLTPLPGLVADGRSAIDPGSIPLVDAGSIAF